MFTGIIEEMGVVKAAAKTLQGCRVAILAHTVLDDLNIGDSVTVNGVCVTVVGCDVTAMQADLSPETLAVTTLGLLTAGDPVNLERALRLGDRLGGHLVTGHVDGIGVIRARDQEADALHLTLEAPRDILRYCVSKGSITVDGISLTVNEVTDHGFQVTIIPHTAKVTTLGVKRAGDRVNLETDLIGRYVERLFPGHQTEGRSEIAIDREYLRKRGLI